LLGHFLYVQAFRLASDCTYGRSTIADLHRRMVIHRDRRNQDSTRAA
jgi:hypothetical protein